MGSVAFTHEDPIFYKKYDQFSLISHYTAFLSRTAYDDEAVETNRLSTAAGVSLRAYFVYARNHDRVFQIYIRRSQEKNTVRHWIDDLTLIDVMAS